jgi:hypothetical protein
MTDPISDEALALLREIRDNQRAHLELARGQLERVERINTRAEAIQARSAGMVELGRKLMYAMVPLVVLLLAILAWPFVERLWP